MKWKRGKRARRHDNQALLVLDHPFHRADERHVKLVRERKVEQDRLAGCFLQLLKIKTGSECRDLLSEILGAHCYRVPVEAVAREDKNIGFSSLPGSQKSSDSSGASNCCTSSTFNGCGFTRAA